VYADRWHDRRPLLTCGSLGALRSQGGLHTPYAQQIKIEMRLALFFSILRDRTSSFSRTTNDCIARGDAMMHCR
jgi:hypothetical protein